MAWYRAGTITVTNNSAAVTGSGTNFLTGIAIGEGLVAPDGKVYEITVITNATSLTLGSLYTGTSLSGQSYAIAPTQSYVRDLVAQVSALISSYASAVSGAIAGLFGDGTLTQPGVAFSADLNTGIRRIGADNIGIVTGGVDRISVDASGNVGVGVSGGSSRISVTGAGNAVVATLAGNTTGNPVSDIVIQRTGAASSTIGQGAGIQLLNSTQAKAIALQGNDDQFQIWANTGSNVWVERMRLDASGNVGLGVTPSAWSGFKAIDIGAVASIASNGSGSVFSTNVYYNGGNYAYKTAGAASNYTQLGGSHLWYSAASGLANAVIPFSTVMALDASGNLGIGTGSPFRKLSVAGVSTSYMDFNASTYRRFTIGSESAGFVVYDDTASTYRMAIDASGNLGVGTTTPVQRVTVQSAATVGNKIALNLNNPYGYGVGNGTATVGLRFNRSTSDAGSTAVMADIYGGNVDETSSQFGFLAFATRSGASEVTTERMRIDSNGNVGIGANPIATIRNYTVSNASSAASQEYASYSYINAVATSGSTSKYGGAFIGAAATGLNHTGSVGGIQGAATIQNAGVITGRLVGVSGVISTAAAGTITDAASAFQSSVSNVGASTFSGTLFSYSAPDISATSTGINAAYSGAYSSATGKYNLYMSGTAPNYFSGDVIVFGAGGLGYGTGSGGTVTQATSRATAIPAAALDKTNGAITMFSAAGSATPASFTVNNAKVSATDTISLSVKSATNKYIMFVTAVSAGSYEITYYTTGGTATDAPVINFAVIKAVTA